MEAAAPGADVELMCKTLQVFYSDVSENQSGRFLKVSEASVSRSRSTIIIPAGNASNDGWEAFRNLLVEIHEASQHLLPPLMTWNLLSLQQAMQSTWGILEMPLVLDLCQAAVLLLCLQSVLWLQIWNSLMWLLQPLQKVEWSLLVLYKLNKRSFSLTLEAILVVNTFTFLR
ncbi:hypothetical protein CY35_01G198800 [Sphagnum magellanicum]|nr:hypothetical protein CY35_01G198800 [Sphagnum magellanicum]